MLRKLSVENYALIDRLDMELCDSLNIITGETGAGKSILLGALGLLLGNRCDASVLKEQQSNCVVEGVFEIGGYELEGFFANNDIDYDNTTVIRRVISPAGKSRAYINDLPVQLITLRELGSYLIDIHSQHQSLLLGEDGFRISTLDSVAAHRPLTDEYSAVYHSLRSAEKELAATKEQALNNQRDEEWLRFQWQQLADASLAPGEQAVLEQQQSELSHAEQIREALSLASDYLEEDETGILPRLKTIEHRLSGIGGHYTKSGEFSARIRSAMLELRDLGDEFSGEADRMESDSGRLEAVGQRLDTIYSLQQKHKVQTLEELIELQQEFGRRLALIDDCDQSLAKLEKRIAELTEKAKLLAGRISEGRRKAAGAISKHIEKALAGLGMPGSEFTVEITPSQALRSSGGDDVRFLFSANRDIPPAPVEKIASGGEVSRLMLALKSIVAQSTKLPTIIFDEIDTGVSGRIADAMGNIISELARGMQVINITHLPQVASKGECHFHVYKESGAGPVRTLIRKLTQQQRVEEIAKMLSGSDITAAATAQARLLLGMTD